MEPYFTEMVGCGPTFTELQSFIKEHASSNDPILLLGEAGVGKEIAARSIHLNSSRRNHPFLVVDCSLYYEGELERELFGEEKEGQESRRGILEFSSRGSCYLANIEELGPSVQERLYNYLDTGYLQRVGSKQPVSSKVRLILSSDKDLEGFAHGGLFLRPLFESIHKETFSMDPLRQHPEDIRPFIRQLTQLFKAENKWNEGTIEIAQETWAALEAYPWPGNYDELKTEFLRLMKAGVKTVTPNTLSPEIAHHWEGCMTEPGIRQVVEEIEGYIKEFQLMMKLDLEYGSSLLNPQSWDLSFKDYSRVSL